MFQSGKFFSILFFIIFILSGCFSVGTKDNKSVPLVPQWENWQQKSSAFYDFPSDTGDKKTKSKVDSLSLLKVDSLSALKPNQLSKSPFDSLTNDSTKKLKKISVGKIDSTRLDSNNLKIKATPSISDSLFGALDSTERLKQFTYRRPNQYTPDPISSYRYSLFLGDPRSVKKDITVDSSLSHVLISEKIGDMDVRDPVLLDFKTYTDLRYQQNINSNFRSLISRQGPLKKVDAIEELLSKISNLEISVPGGGGNLFRTIFGPAKILISVKGSIDIKMGWQNQTNSLQTSLNGTGSQSDPVFDQQFQMSVKGKVGDKLDIDADWSTQRTFEYENNLRLTYTGYEDEIIQKIEAGNVSLTIPNNRYIAGSMALFGVKSKMQLGPLTWTFLVSQKKGKTETKNVSGGSQEQSIEIPLSKYAKDKHFFVGGFFRDKYNDLFSVPGSQGTIGTYFQRLEVWVVKNRDNSTKDKRNAVAVAFLGEARPNNAEDPFVNEPDPSVNGYPQYVLDALRKGNNSILPTDPNYPPANEIYDGYFRKLEENVDYNFNDQNGWIDLNAPLEQGEVLAVSFQLKKRNGSVVEVGDPAALGVTDTSSSRLLLKLLRDDSGSNPNNPYLWSLMMRNIYELGSTNISEDGLDLDIQYATSGLYDPKPSVFSKNLLEVLQLNRLGPNNSTTTLDSKFDFVEGVTVNSKRGEIIFPNRKPLYDLINQDLLLNSSLSGEEKNNYIFRELYETTYDEAQKLNDKNKYYFIGKVKGGISDKYMLGFNIAQGSVKVTSKGISLSEGRDYTVDYQIGMVQIKDRSYLLPGSDLAISYESNDLFTLASKTYIGSRFDLDISDKAKLGLTWMRYAEKPLTDKVRVGDEALLNNIWGMDGSYEYPNKFMTKLTNWIPGIQVQEESNISLKAEFAQILPGHPTELDTKLDPDGVAYIDDFEGSKRSVPIGFGNSWSLSSPPELLSGLPNITDNWEKTFYRADLKYYVNQQYRVPIKNIWPERSTSSKDNSITVFTLEYFPKSRGTYNFSPDLPNTIYLTNGQTWGGIQKAMPQYITNLVTEKIEFIEFWFQITDEDGVNYTSNTGEMNIDLGSISEDIIPNGKLNTEKGLKTLQTQTDIHGFKYPIGNTSAAIFSSKDEDVGLDGLSDDEEKIAFADFLNNVRQAGSAIPADELERIMNDPSGDNYTYRLGSANYDGVNGSEGNSQTGNQDRIYEDTEDMNQSGTLNQTNSYFRYKLNLAQTSLSDDSVKAKQNYLTSVNKGQGGSWYQVRIPLSDWKTKVGNIQDLSYAEFIRISLTGFSKPVMVQLATFDFVSNQWLPSESDSVMSVSVVNIEENPNDYNSPPNVVREKDRTRPDENIQLNEQSLYLKFNGLKEGEERTAYKNVFSANGGALVLTNYRRLKMFVHAEDGQSKGQFFDHVTYTDTTNYSAEVFLRFGTDASNYYEISQPLHPDTPKGGAPASWDPNNEFNIDLDMLAGLKALKISDTLIVRSPKGFPPGTRIILRGSPTMNNIKIFRIGLRNPKYKGTMNPISHNIWVDELRVTGFKEDAGYAVAATTSMKFSDFAVVNFNIEHRDSEFRGITDKPRGDKSATTSWAVAASANLDKFISNDKSWSIPLAVSHTESVSQPKYLSGSDILLDEAAKQSGLGEKLIDLNRSVTVSNGFSLTNVRKVTPSKNSVAQATIDNLSFDYSYSITNSRNAQTQWAESWNWSTGLGYRYSFKEVSFFQPLYYPMQIFHLDYLWLDKIFDEKTVKDWEETKLYLKPTSFDFKMMIRRSRAQSKQRTQLDPTKPTNDFSTNRTAGFAYKITDNLNMSVNGTLDATLDYLLLDEDKEELPSTLVYKKLLKQMAVFDLGKDKQYNQKADFSYKFPILLFANLTGSYSSNYSWQNANPEQMVGKNAGWSNNISLNSSIRLSDLIGDKFKKNIIDSKARDTVSTSAKLYSDFNSLMSVITGFDTFTFQFTQTNTYATNGVDGGTGALNFFPFDQSWWPNQLKISGRDEYPGPGIGFQLGLTSNPGRRVTSTLIMGSDGRPTTQYLLVFERYSQINSFNFGTGFKPTSNMSVDLKWKMAWNFSKEYNLDIYTKNTSNNRSGGGYSRSFISLFGDFESVKKALPKDPALGVIDYSNNSVVSGFRDGLELFNFSSRIKNALSIRNVYHFPDEWQDLIPLPNWSVTFTGVEKFPLWSKLVQSANLSHSYTGDYSNTYVIRPDAGKPFPNTFLGQGQLITPFKDYSSPKMSERFSPLLGLTLNWKGNLSTRFSWNTSKTISLSTTNYQVSTNKVQEYTMGATYTLAGNVIPLPKWLSTNGTLKSDVDFSVNLSYAIDQTTIDALAQVGNIAAPVIGQTRMTIEPRIGYTISSRVNATGFFSYTNSKPLKENNTTPEITRWVAGVEVHISIQ